MRMTEAQTILKMIEVVDPGDDIRLDMIDDYVDVYLNPKHNRHCGATGQMIMPAPFYSRSRDTLKSIRPEGWTLTTIQAKDFTLSKLSPPYICDIRYLTSKRLPTEELAELHAIIQAIEYERNR